MRIAPTNTSSHASSHTSSNTSSKVARELSANAGVRQPVEELRDMHDIASGDTTAWALAHANIVGALEIFGCTALDGEADHSDGVLTFASSRTFPGPFQIGALRDDVHVPADRVIERAVEFFGARSLAFCVWTAPTGDDDLIAAVQAAGFGRAGDAPVMVTTQRCVVPEIVDGIELRRLTDADQELARAFADVADVAFAEGGQPAGTISDQLTPAFFSHPDVHAVVAIERSGSTGSTETAGIAEVVAGAMSVGAAGSVSVHFVATAAEHRRRGLGALVTAVVTNDALDRGAPQVSLQASDLGRSVYAELGFADIGRATFWFGVAN